MWAASGAAGRGGVLHFRLPPPSLPPRPVVVQLPACGRGSARAAATATSACQQRHGIIQQPMAGISPRLPAAGTAATWGAAAQQHSLRHRRRYHACRAAAAAAAAADSSDSKAASNGAQASEPARAAAAAAGEELQAHQAQQAQQGGGLSLDDLWVLLRPDWLRLAGCVLFTAFSVGCAVMVAPSLGKVVDIISRGTAATQQELAAAVGRLGAVYICSNVSLAVQVALALALGEGLAHRLRSRLFGALLSRDTLFFDRVKTGQMVAWLGQDIEVLQGTVAKLLGARGIRSAFETIGIILVLFTLSWPLAAALLVSAPLLTPLIAQLSTRIGAASRASQAAANDVSAAADEVVENMRVVKLFAQQQRELTRFQGLLDAAHTLALKVLRLQALLDASSRVRNMLCVLCTLGLGAYMALNSTVSLGTCYSFFVFSFSFAFALGNLTNTVGDVARAAGAVNRTMLTLRQAMGDEADLLARDADEETTGSAALSSSGQQQQQQQPAGQRLDDSWSGAIEFDGVTFSHPGGWTMENVSFSIPAGKTVALVGPSGGGKSTLASLLMGLYSPAEGAILVDGVPLADLDMQWWRDQLGVVAQEPGLLTGRVADIIRYGAPDASDSEVEWAARAAQAHSFICQLPQGYQTSIGGASGQELSGGQRQRLAIARALLRRPRVLVLDEATSALDVETELGVSRELETAGRGVSSLIIAHRLSTVRRADSIVVVAGGRAVESGTHAELMAREGGVYWTLVSTAESKGQDALDLPQAAAGNGGEGRRHSEAAEARQEVAAAAAV